MNPNELKMLIALQPKIKTAMGEWQTGDRGYVNGLGIGILHANGLMYFDNGTAISPKWCDSTLIPLTIDPVNPERGLWGMLDWNQFTLGEWGVDGQIILHDLAIYKNI